MTEQIDKAKLLEWLRNKYNDAVAAEFLIRSSDLAHVINDVERGIFDEFIAHLREKFDAKEETIRQRDAEIERLRGIIGTATYELEQLERVLDMPKRGYVRNGYNGVLRTLHEVEMCPRCKARPMHWDGHNDYKLCLPCFTSNS